MSITGRVFISLNGQRIRSKEGAKLDIGGLKRDPAMSDSGVDGFTEAVVPPQVDFKLNHSSSTSLADLHAFKGTLTYETDSGRIYTITEAYSMVPPQLDKGEVTLQYGGTECLEG